MVEQRLDSVRAVLADSEDADEVEPDRWVRLHVMCLACPGPDHRHTAEFCENGAKAVAEEANKERVGRDFFERYSVEELSGYTDY